MSSVHDALQKAGKRYETISPHYTRGTILVEDADVVSGPRLVESDEAPSLRDYWQVVTKHKWKIAACFVAAVMITALIVFSTTPIYTARAILLIERTEHQVVNIKQVLSESAGAEETSYYESQYQVLRSRSLAAEVIKAQRLDKNPEFTNPGGDGNFIVQLVRQLWDKPVAWLNSLLLPTIPSNSGNSGDLYGVKSRLIDAYAGMLEVEPVKRSRLVKIGISAPSPVLAAEIANAHAEGYVRQGFTLRAQANEGARKFLQTKLEELQARVETSEDALNRFRRRKGIISLDDKENIVVDRLADLNRRLTEAEAERIGLEAQARLIKRRDYDSLPAVIGNGLIQNLRAQVVQLESEHAKLAAQFLSGYPRLAQVKAQLEETKSRLTQQINSVVEGINSAYFAAAGKERALKLQMDKQKSDALALKDAAVEYAILARQADTNKQLYDSILGRYKEINLAGEIPASNVSILDRAEIPTRPSKPNKRLNLMLGALLGLMGGLGLALLLEHLNNTLRTPEEVERFLRLPNLVVVPDFLSLPKPRKNGKSRISRPESILHSKLCVPSKKPVASSLPLSMLTEAYRKLRTAIFLSRPGESPKTILFTSGTNGEGKTMTVANTAILLAQMELQVLVIDADLRKPSCHKALRVRGGRGLTDFLAGQERLDDVIKPTSVANLSVLNCGSTPPNPTELVGSKRMNETLAALRDRYDFILIDSPPVMPVSDAVILSTMVDGVVLVVRGDETKRHIVKAAVSQLGNGQGKILGVVLNRVDVRSAEYKDYYKYYSPNHYYSSATLT
jgi:polysaccharide biosynthesis transport protein